MTELWDIAAPVKDQAQTGYREVHPRHLVGVPDVRIVDVREPVEFNGELQHIPGAELLPLGELEAAAAAWPKDDTVLLVCRSGNRSEQAARALSQRGFTRLINLQGGMIAYNEASLPLERS